MSKLPRQKEKKKKRYFYCTYRVICSGPKWTATDATKSIQTQVTTWGKRQSSDRNKYSVKYIDYVIRRLWLWRPIKAEDLCDCSSSKFALYSTGTLYARVQSSSVDIQIATMCNVILDWENSPSITVIIECFSSARGVTMMSVKQWAAMPEISSKGCSMERPLYSVLYSVWYEYLNAVMFTVSYTAEQLNRTTIFWNLEREGGKRKKK